MRCSSPDRAPRALEWGGKYVRIIKPPARSYEANQVLGYNLREFVLMDRRKRWRHPKGSTSILSTSISILKVLKTEGIKADFVAGHSLGEYSALVASGAISLAEALKLVVKRSQLMAKADPAQKGQWLQY